MGDVAPTELSFSQFCESMNDTYTALLSNINSVNQLLLAEGSYARVEHLDGDVLNIKHSRAFIAEKLMDIHYCEGVRTATEFAKCIAFASNETLAAIEGLNQAKESFRLCHEGIRRCLAEHYDASFDISRVFRDSVLKPIGVPLLNLDACDRKVPCFSKPIAMVSWYSQNSEPGVSGERSSSNKLCVADAMKVLEEQLIRETGNADFIYQELKRLSSISHMPVYRKSPYRVSSYHFYIKFEDTSVVRNYGLNPIFCTPHPFLMPKMGKADEHRQGRPPSIEKVPISVLLPNWYLLKPRLKRGASGPEKSVTSHRGRRHNPYVHTAVADIRIGFRQGKTKVSRFFVVSKGGKKTNYSIDRHGIQGAWQRAIDFCDLSEDYDPPVEAQINSAYAFFLGEAKKPKPSQ